MWSDLRRDVVLSRGLIDEQGTQYRHASLRTLSGLQEAAWADAGDPLARDRIHALLSASLERIGDYERPDADLVAALSRSDQSRLLFGLRRLLFGERILVVTRCANPGCGELIDISMRVDELSEPEPQAQPEWIEVETPDGVARVRPATGADELACGRAGVIGPERAALLWSRLIQAVGAQPCAGPADWWALAPATRQAIALGLAEADSDGADILSACPACGAAIELRADPATLMLRELHHGVQRLGAELHCLAFHYGWTEAESLQLPRQRRWQYLELLNRELEGRPLIDGWT
jgi:hypothetical protein